MTNRNYNSWLRTTTIDFGCGFGFGAVFGILGSIKGANFDISTIGLSGLILGVLSAIFGRSFWRFISKRKAAGFPEHTNHDVKEKSNNESVQ